MKFLYQRFAIYITPTGELGDKGAKWLGYDARTGAAPFLGDPVVAPMITERPRKYGFHATIKAPFSLAIAYKPADLCAAFSDICADIPAAHLGPLRMTRMGGFFALAPHEQHGSLNALESAIVRAFDKFRAPVTSDDLTHRRAKGLRPDQEERFLRWGYPHVFEHFRAHFTLTGKVPSDQRADVAARAAQWFSPVLDLDYQITELALMGERPDGYFERIDTAALQTHECIRI